MTEHAPTYECMLAAGRDPGVLFKRRLLIGGSGNAGSNLVLSAAVLGITAAYVDPDRAEPRNLPHSPFLTAAPGADGLLPSKAELLAKSHVEQSRREDQIAYWAGCPIQAVPLGVVRRFDGMIVGIDDGPSRAWAARAGALLGIPTIVAGFYPPTGNFVATANRDADAPCYFCLRPDESPVRASSSFYSSPDGHINPALQTVPAATMNVALDAMLRLWQDDDRYDARVFRLDLDEGSAELTRFAQHPDCPGPHEHLPEPMPVPFGPEAPLRTVFELAQADGLHKPVIEFPSPFIVSLACRACGDSVAVDRPDWAVNSAPRCPDGCRKNALRQGARIEPRVCADSPLAERTLRSLGLGPLALAVVEDDESDEVRVYELAGVLEDTLTPVGKVSR